MKRPKKLTGVTGKGNCAMRSRRSASSSARWWRRIDFQQIDLRPRQAGEALRQLFRIGAEKRLRVELAAGEALQECRHGGIDGGAASFGVGDDLAVGRQVAHDVQVGPQALAVALVRGRPQEDRPGHDRLHGRELGAVQPQPPRQMFDALPLGGPSSRSRTHRPRRG